MTSLPVRPEASTAARAPTAAVGAVGPGELGAVDPGDSWPVRLAFWLVLALTSVFSVVWLAIGTFITATAYSPDVRAGVDAAAAAGNAWAEGVLTAVGRAEPLGQAVLDHAFSGLSLVLAVVLLCRGRPRWVARLLALAMIGSAGAFNLQAHGATAVVERAIGLPIGQAHQVQLHGVACAAYIMALLLFPTGRWRFGPGAGRVASGLGVGRLPVLLPGALSLLLVGVGTALLPHTVSCILFFGFVVPLVGLAALRRRARGGATADGRAQARLLFSALVGAFGIIVVLALITLVLLFLRQPGLTLVDPTAVGSTGSAAQPTALLFWFSRLAAVAVAAAALVATRRGGLWSAERVFSRGLASVLVVVLIGGGWVVVRAVIDRLYGVPTAWASIVATVVASVGLLPLYLRVEQLVERLLYGSRPTPYRVLADVAALSGFRGAEGPNLAAVAEAIGRALGARSCRLTVLRPGLRDRTYGWDANTGAREWTGEAPGAAGPPDHLVLPIRQGAERIGTIAVDRGAVAGLQNERRHLLEDVADSLGAILQASRLSIELERQLRAALAHAEEIAESRRTAVAEMDSERRAIERDLHDGAQHHLVTLRLALGLVEHQVAGGQLSSARERIGQLAVQLRAAEAVLAETATGVSSIVLSEQGLVAALRADLADSRVTIDNAAAGAGAESPRFPIGVETAVYFCCLESVNNARKHAGGAPVAVRLEVVDRTLRFEVRDSGPGFTPPSGAGPPPGSGGRGLRNLTARIAAIGGTLVIESAPGAGTVVRGEVPLPTTPLPEPPTPAGTFPANGADTGQPHPAHQPATVSDPNGEPTLPSAVRELLDSAVEHSSGRPERERLLHLRARLAGPLRIGVVGAPEVDPVATAAALDAAAPGGILVLAPPPGHERSAADQVDALVVPPGPDAAAPGLWVLPLAGRLLPPGGALRTPELATLRKLAERSERGSSSVGDPPDDSLPHRFGGPDLRFTVHALRRGVPEALVGPLAARTRALRARTVMWELEALVRATPGTAEAVFYRLEEVRAGTHELAEMELVDALADGSILLVGNDREAAERLLGLDGTGTTARLGLAADATDAAVHAALIDELRYWRLLGGHPAATSSSRRAAEILARTCESLLSHTQSDGHRDPRLPG